MCALFNPINPTGKGIKRLLVAHTVAMFSFVTVFTALNLNFLSISYIDNREFPGILNGVPPGPLGYQYYIYNKAAGIISTVMFLLNNWLADGLLVNPTSSLVAQGLTEVAILALSLLYYLCYELLGHRLPLLNILCNYWYVPESPASSRHRFHLTSPMQR